MRARCAGAGRVRPSWPVRDDKTSWQALQVLHGGDKAAKKGGPLHGVKSHQRAALAAVIAWAFKERLR